MDRSIGSSRPFTGIIIAFFFLFANAMVNGEENTLKLKAVWNFDNSTADSSGNAINGILHGSPTFVTDDGKGCLSLDGIDDYVVLGNASSFDFGDGKDFTISFWVKTEGWIKEAAIISNKDWASGNNTGWVVAGGTSAKNSFQWNYKGATGPRVDFDPSAPAINDNTWHHIAIVHNRTNKAMFYVDGKFVAEQTISASTGTLNSGFPLVIGTDGAQGANWHYFFKGLIDDVRVYGQSLSGLSVTALSASRDAVLTEEIDIDKDGLANTLEEQIGSNKLLKDSDNDGWFDLDEYEMGTSLTSAESNPEVLPEGWQLAKLGGQKGKALYYNDQFVLYSDGNIGGFFDSGQFVYLPLDSEKATIVAKLERRPDSYSWGENGIMIRDSLKGNSSNVFVTVPKAVGVTTYSRATVGDWTWRSDSGYTSTPVWLKIEKEGTVIKSFHSVDGITWVLFSTKVIKMDGTNYIGLACATKNLFSKRAEFSHVSVTRYLADPVVTPNQTRTIGNQVVEFTSATTGADLRYTLDGSEPTENSAQYLPLTATQLALGETPGILVTPGTEVKVKAFKTGYQASKTVIAVFPQTTKVVNNLPVVTNYVPGLTASYYHGTNYYTWLPDFSKLTPYKVTMFSNNFDYPTTIDPIGQSDFAQDVAMTYKGSLYIPEDGEYTFTLDSDDQGKMFIDGTMVAEGQYWYNNPTTATYTKGLHAFEIKYTDGAYAKGKLSAFWQKTGSDKEIIPSKFFFSADTDADFLADDWEAIVKGNLESDGTEDSDADGYTLAQEVTVFHTSDTDANSHPKPASTSTTNTAIGLAVTFHEAYNWNRMLDMQQTPYYKAGSVDNLNQQETWGQVEKSVRIENFGAVFTGYIKAPSDGAYSFFLTSNDGAILFIDGQRVCDNDELHGMIEVEGTIPLKAGKHSIRVDFFERSEMAGLILEWAGPGFQRTVVPASALSYDPAVVTENKTKQDFDLDGISDLVEDQIGSDKYHADTDGDGLLDGFEYKLWGAASVQSTDTDGDGVSDYIEHMVAMTNVTVADFNGVVQNIASVNGSSGTAIRGNWENEGTAKVAFTRNGEVSYSITIDTQGTYALEVFAGEHNPLASSHNSFTLELYADSNYVGRGKVVSNDSADGSHRFFLPQMAAGEHTITIKWINIKDNTFLRLSKMSLQNLGGADSDNNGVADWQQNRLHNTTGVIMKTGETVIKSYVSPACVEGKTISASMVKGESTYYPLDLRSESFVEGTKFLNTVFGGVTQPTGPTWFSNVPLNPESETILNMSYQNGTVTETKHIVWTPTDIYSCDEVVKVRLNDSLKLIAKPGDLTGGVVTITIGDDTPVTKAIGDTLNYKFETTGDVSITATITPAGAEPITRTIKVKVIAASFSTNPICYSNQWTKWECPAITKDLELEFDPSLSLFANQTENHIRFDLLSKVQGKSTAVARLFPHGPIAARAEVTSIEFSLNPTNSLSVISTFPDGSQLLEAVMYLSNVPGNILILKHIHAGGCVFLDGTKDLRLTAKDFDENGFCRFNIVRPAGVTSSACHRTTFSQIDNNK